MKGFSINTSCHQRIRHPVSGTLRQSKDSKAGEAESSLSGGLLLIHPPIAKPAEAPAGIAQLAGALAAHGVPYTLLDANLEGLLSLIAHPAGLTRDRWSQRAFKHRQQHLATLRQPESYHRPDVCRRAVADLNRLVAQACNHPTIRLSLTDYQDAGLSPVCSADLQQAFETPERNPFYIYFSSRLEHLIVQHQPAAIGISLNYLSQALCTFAILGYLQQHWPALRLMLGGGLVTSWMRQRGWHNPFAGMVDDLVAGAGETAVLKASGLEENSFQPHYRPCYDGLPLTQYLAPKIILPYSASRGCYWRRCKFCPELVEGNSYQAVNASQVLHDVQALITASGAGWVHLLDSAIPPALLKTLAANPPARPWYGFARFSPQLADDAFCRALRAANCRMLQLGLESGDQEVLEQEGKGIDLEVARKALRAIHRAGIGTYIYLLFGTPSESLVKARRTLAYTVEQHENIDYLNLALFNLPVDAAPHLTRRSHTQGDLSLYTDFEHPHGWQRHLVRRFLDREFKRHPAIQAILRRDPLLFGSSHAPFFR